MDHDSPRFHCVTKVWHLEHMNYFWNFSIKYSQAAVDCGNCSPEWREWSCVIWCFLPLPLQLPVGSTQLSLETGREDQGAHTIGCHIIPTAISFMNLVGKFFMEVLKNFFQPHAKSEVQDIFYFLIKEIFVGTLMTFSTIATFSCLPVQLKQYESSLELAGSRRGGGEKLLVTIALVSIVRQAPIKYIQDLAVLEKIKLPFCAHHLLKAHKEKSTVSLEGSRESPGLPGLRMDYDRGGGTKRLGQGLE